MFAASVVLLAAASSAVATVFVTSPVASTTFTAGQVATISWQDDNNSPSLAQFGASKVSIYVGNVQQQTMLQPIVPSVDVSTTSSIQFTPDGTIGPNSNEYFIRFESLNLKDATQPQYPALAFSAKFTMAGMTGTFNTTVQAQIDGQSTAGTIGGAATAATSSAASTVGATTTSASSAAKSSSPTKTGASASPTHSNAAVSIKDSMVWMVALAGTAVGASLL